MFNETSTIKTIADVKELAKYLYHERGVAFHPDDGFEDYVCDGTQEATFTKSEVKLFNRLMGECFDVCEREQIDIYKIMAESHPILNALT